MEEDIKILKKIKKETLNAAANAYTSSMSDIWRKEAKAIENILNRLEQLEKENEHLVRVAIETAFDKDNNDTEFLCRRLLTMGKIKLEDGVYKRNKLPYEEDGFTIDGILYDREKIFFIEDDKLDEYTKQLETEKEQLKAKIEQLEQAERVINDVVSHLEYYLIGRLDLKDSQEEFKKLLKMLKRD